MIEIASVTDGHEWMKDEDGNMMPVWVEGGSLPNILIDDDDLLDIGESDDGDYEDDETATDETDDSNDDYYI